MDVASFRQALATHLGADAFRKFVAQIRRAKRLRYWQEGAWRTFIAGHPEFDCSFDELRAALHICEVHGRELEPDDVGIFRGCRDYTREYIEARSRLFPNAPPDTVSTEGPPSRAIR